MKKLIILLMLLSVGVYAQQYELPRTNPGDEIVRHPNYTLKYNEQYEQPDWVAYRITRDTVRGTAKRPSGFKSDPLVPTKSADNSDYTNSGYDRGHLCPSADFRADQKLLNETFIMSNITPMLHDFNAGDWGDVEDHERKWAMQNGELFICTGPILKDGPSEFIGKKSKVGVAKRFYKVILDNQEPELKMIAFIVPHREGLEDISIYAVTVREAERITGFDFFPALPDDIEQKLETELDLRKWGLNPNAKPIEQNRHAIDTTADAKPTQAAPKPIQKPGMSEDQILIYVLVGAGVAMVILGIVIFVGVRMNRRK
ncbi:MAG TPA: DNA/RNA endonuclease [Lentisphaeria bacterium]|nr:MAG: hypothetical protein A2X45_13440 [Lentisphaerae bacterium GWF2_50_93]HCE42857.1 DNA/RNA endonuclease [Lentisphaeria bacterium]